MNTNTFEKTSTEPAPTTPKSGGGKLHNSPVARLLEKVSKLSAEYAEYQLENCSSRRMVL